MKKLRVFAILITVLAGCGKGSNGTAGLYYMRAGIDSASFDAEGVSKATLGYQSSGGIDYTYITGKTDDGRVIKLTLVNTTGVALVLGVSMPVNTSSANADYYPKGFDSTFVHGVYGSIILKNISPNYEGTFSFTCADSTHVLNGTFLVRAQ